LNSNGSENILLSEIFAWVMSINSKPPKERLLNISFFANYSYHDWTTVFLNMPVLPVHLYFPGDYRNEKR